MDFGGLKVWMYFNYILFKFKIIDNCKSANNEKALKEN